MYYVVDTGTIKVASHKLHNEFQYSRDRNKRSHASRYIVDLIADEKQETRYGKPMLDDTIADLLPSDIPPSTAAAATTTAYDMKINTFTTKETEACADSDRHCTYTKGGKYRLLSENVHTILAQVNESTASTQLHTPLITNCAHSINKDQDIMSIDMPLDIYGPSTALSLPISGTHSSLGFVFHSNLRTPTIQDCDHGTPANNIERWRWRFRNTKS